MQKHKGTLTKDAYISCFCGLSIEKHKFEKTQPNRLLFAKFALFF